MFMHTDIALADINCPIQWYITLSEALKKKKKKVEKWVKGGKYSISAFRAINSGIFSIMKSCRSYFFSLNIQAMIPLFTPDLAFFHHHCLVNHHLLRLLLVNLHPHHHPCDPSSQRNGQN